MGKRSNFARLKRDAYFTPYDAVIPLFPHLKPNSTFGEPCAGDGRLVAHLQQNTLKCVFAYDIEPKAKWIEKGDVLFFNEAKFSPCDYIITNPPWDREVMHKMINKFVLHAPTWLLFDADWIHTVQATPYAHLCRKIVSVGRVKWIEDSKGSGKDNCCWYLFDQGDSPTEFVFRSKKR